MRGVTGTPEEVMEWLQTGLDANHIVTFTDIDGKARFTVQQIYRDREMHERVRGLFDELGKAVRERKQS